MNLKNILKQIEQASPEALQQKSDRRDALKNLGSKVALAAVPFAISSLFEGKAYAQSSGDTTTLNALNYLLQLEYFQYNFYHSALATGSNTTTTLIPAADRAGFELIEANQLAHINYLRKAIDGMGSYPFVPKNYTGNAFTGNPYSPASYDFTAANKFRIYENYSTFLELAQALEDLMVRAYIGTAEALAANADNRLTDLVTMSTVEARHAAYIRNTRRDIGVLDIPKPWITNNISPTFSLVDFYLKEDNVIQRDINVTTLPGNSGNIPVTAATEAFDEPLDFATVMQLLKPFIL